MDKDLGLSNQMYQIKATLSSVAQIECSLNNKVTIYDKNYTCEQTIANKEWKINHNLSKMPSVTTVDMEGNVVIGNVKYIDLDNVVITFSTDFSGKVYLN